MQRQYESHRDRVEFRMIYIAEAHASDSDWPVPYAKDRKITEHKDYGQRCDTAKRLLEDESLTIPTLIDGMDDGVSKVYKAHPDRIFLVRTDGRLGVAASRGPMGFAPALEETGEWLKAYKETGREPPIPNADRKAPAESRQAR